MSVADIGATVVNASRLGANAGVILHAAENRAALALLEVEAAALQVRPLVVVGSICLACLFLSGLALTLAFAGAFWDSEHRVLALGLLGLVELAAAIAAAAWAMRRVRQWVMFRDLREQLAKDIACLRELLATGHD